MTTDCIFEFIEEKYPERRKLHIYGVCLTAKKLARRYGGDVKKAETAALFHDMFRSASDLGHGELASAAMARDYGIDDEDVLNAVRYHTTGRPGMSLLEKIIYLADAIEPSRDYPGVEKIRALAYKDIDRACMLLMDQTIEYIMKNGSTLDAITIRARNYLKKEGGIDG